MKANETGIQQIIEGTRQYIVPLFQRPYSWTDKEWTLFWNDLLELSELERPRSHFIGSIVSMPTLTVPEGVPKFLLIDGQQRLTTIFILLALLRNNARDAKNTKFANEINDTLLVNFYKDEDDFFKLMPTQIDRTAYKSLIVGESSSPDSQIQKAYDFFEKKLRQTQLQPEIIKSIITKNFSIVSIVLDPDDNPYLVFESLNAKGRPLTQADLIRNYFFMRVHVKKQETIYQNYWQPMQEALGDNMGEFIRHYLMRQGPFIKQTDVYYALKDNVSQENALDYLKDLHRCSLFYKRIIDPSHEPDLDLRRCFRRLNRIEVTTAYPLLLNFYDDYASKRLAKADFFEILQTLENYLIRRFVCNAPTSHLKKIFYSVAQHVRKNRTDPVRSLQLALRAKNYPKDSTFFNDLIQTRLYGSANRQSKTKLILESLEASFGHHEAVDLDGLTVEHVMPQTLSEGWKQNLGEDWEEIHELYLHTIGNLTLTGYNSTLSNADFSVKKTIYKESHLSLNSYFDALSCWRRDDIERRAEFLASQALNIWRYFGPDTSHVSDGDNVTGTTPTHLCILGQKFDVSSWRDVLEKTLNTIADLEPDKFEIIATSLSRYISKDKSKLRDSRRLENGYFVEVHLSAKHIQRLCNQAITIVELSSDDWAVDTV